MMAFAILSLKAQETSISSISSISSMPSSASSASPASYFSHLDLSVNVGTSGIGFDLATPIGNYVQLRAGYEFMPGFHVGINFPVEVGGEPAEQYDEQGQRIESRFDRLA